MPLPTLLAPEPGPHTLVEKRWGGARLGALRGAPGRRIGESWEFSTLPGAESHALGQPLGALLGRSLPFLAKLIDTSLPLSVQVHPPPDHVRGWGGKEEAWVVLEADPGAAVWAGLRPGVSRAEVARRARDVAAGAGPERLLDALRRVPVQRGSVLLVPSGTVHSIGAGILLAEIQQPADLTHRLYDWNSERALHIDLALEALDPAAEVQLWHAHEAPRSVRGVHLELALLAEGSHVLDLSVEALVIPVNGRCELQAGEPPLSAGPGELRLFTGGRLGVRVASGGLVVVGRADA